MVCASCPPRNSSDGRGVVGEDGYGVEDVGVWGVCTPTWPAPAAKVVVTPSLVSAHRSEIDGRRPHNARLTTYISQLKGTNLTAQKRSVKLFE
jgi:hypothetical protein